MLNHQRLIVGASVGLVLALALVWFWFGRVTKQEPTGAATTTVAILFPAGEPRPGIVQPSTATSSAPDDEKGVAPAPIDRTGRFFRITNQPVGGALILGRGTSSALVYVERITGHLYRLNPGAAGAERISNTTIPKIYRLFGGQSGLPDGKAGTSTQIIFQYLKNRRLQTFSGDLDLSSSAVGDAFLEAGGDLAPLAGRFLPANITELAVAPAQNKVFWLETAGGGTSGYVADLTGSKKDLVFRSPHPEWLAAWVAPTTIALQTSPSAQTFGALYLLNTKTKKLTPLVSNVLGLTALVSPRFDLVFYSGQTDRGLVSGLYDVKKRIFGGLNIQTWADKCVWGVGGAILYCAVPNSLPAGRQYPDDWYRGEVELADNIWKIDAANRRAEIIYSPSQAGLDLKLDAERLLLDDGERTLYLINRRDQRLWALSLFGDFSTGD